MCRTKTIWWHMIVMAITIEKCNNDNIVLTVCFSRALDYEIVMSIHSMLEVPRGKIKSQQVPGTLKNPSKDLNIETDISDNQIFQQHNGM